MSRLLVPSALLWAVLACTSADAPAQQPRAVPVIGFLNERSSDDSWLPAFQQELRELGLTPGSKVVIETRYAEGDVERIRRLAAELVSLNVDILVVGGGVAAQAAKSASSSVPIVFAHVGDPVGAGLVRSLARPGGNITGVSNAAADLAAKQVELLKAAVPGIRRVALLHNPANSALVLQSIRNVARSLDIELDLHEARAPRDVEHAFLAAASRRAEAVWLHSDPVLGSQLSRLVSLAIAKRMPTVYLRPEFALQGGLLAYGPDFAANYRRAARLVAKILRGVKPGELPVELPTKLELVVNLKTAKALGLTIPQAVLQRADLVIE